MLRPRSFSVLQLADSHIAKFPLHKWHDNALPQNSEKQIPTLLFQDRLDRYDTVSVKH